MGVLFDHVYTWTTPTRACLISAPVDWLAHRSSPSLSGTMMVQCMVLLDKWTVQLGNVNKLMMFEFNLHTLIMTFRSVEFIVKSLPSAHCKFGSFSAFMSYILLCIILRLLFRSFMDFFTVEKSILMIIWKDNGMY